MDYRNFEVVLVDDGSPTKLLDNMPEIRLMKKVAAGINETPFSPKKECQ